MSAKNLKLKVGKTLVELTQANYKCAGGEGTVYVKHSDAFKIYHDPAKMIPVGKVKELAVLNQPNILSPREVAYDLQGIPVGFVMPFVDDTQYLVRLFTRGFRDKNGITPDTINALVKRIQDTAKFIHSHKSLIVDANEMNFLTNQAFNEVYFIDTDSYKTPSYPATALMDSVRDRTIHNNQWTEMSDWFALGITMFQMYMGTHPYKARHPDYGRNWEAMMDAGISVFNKKSSLPPNCQDWSVIPKGHLKWFEKVFEYGERVAPPEPDQVTLTAGPVKTQMIASNAKFELALSRHYDAKIVAIRDINGVNYAYTDTSIYAGDKILSSHPKAVGYTEKRTTHDFVPVQGDSPYAIELNGLTAKLKYKSLRGGEATEISATDYFIANDRMYTVLHGGLVESTFTNLGAKVVVSKKMVANIIDTHKIFDGFVVQDMLGTCRVAIPYKVGAAKTLRLTELDGKRIVDAKYMNGVAIVIAESKGAYERLTFVFDKSISEYTLRTETNVSVQDVNFTVLDKGLCVAANGDSIELFYDNSTVKTISDSPLTNNQTLLNWGNKIYVVNGNSIYQLSMKP